MLLLNILQHISCVLALQHLLAVVHLVQSGVEHLQLHFRRSKNVFGSAQASQHCLWNRLLCLVVSGKAP